MIIAKKKEDLSHLLAFWRSRNQQIAFVPTMGALHQGHLRLLAEARASGARTVVSIFVNPTQFNDPGDYANYPVRIENDILLLEAAGADLLFLPDKTELYPGGTRQLEYYELGYLESILEGQYRPGHFQGVCQVMRRLLESVRPDFLFMGSKDYQQCLVVKKLLDLLSLPVEFFRVETVREPDGLAMSSRNLRLNQDQRGRALYIFRTLQFLRQELTPGPLEPLLEKGRALLEREGFRVDYLALAEAESLRPLTHWDGNRPLIALAAAYLGEVRLIDNLQMNR